MSEKRKTRKIGILTSGGDAPGMNCVINAIYKTFRGINGKSTTGIKKLPLELILIKNGFKGIIEKDFQVINPQWEQIIETAVQMGGTVIGSARFEEFKNENIRFQAVKILKEQEIEGVIAIGGDGTYTGLQKLADLGIQCVGIPGTIDNDIASSEFTVGFDTALNTVVEALDRVRQTSNSHSRIAIVEIMGRNCGDLTIHGAAAVNADILSTPEQKIDEIELIRLVKDLISRHQAHSSILIAVTEKLYDVHALAKKLEKETGRESRATVLGQIQRGGTPSAFDRYLATMFGIFAAEQFDKDNKSSRCIGLQDNRLVLTEIQDVLNMPKPQKKVAINKILRLSGIIVKEKQD